MLNLIKCNKTAFIAKKRLETVLKLDSLQCSEDHLMDLENEIIKCLKKYFILPNNEIKMHIVSSGDNADCFFLTLEALIKK